MEECVLREYYERVKNAECIKFTPFYLIDGKWTNIQMDDNMDKLFIDGACEGLL